MYDLIVPFPRKTKAPLYVPISTANGTLSPSSSGTCTLTDAQGDELAAGNVDGTSATSVQVVEWKTIDGTTLALEPGNYLAEFLLNVTDGTIPRVYSYSIILQVPGSRTFSFYPTGMDLQVFLVGAGMLDNPPSANARMIDLDAAMASAVSEWEKLTGWHPFLAAQAEVTRTFDPPGPTSTRWRYEGGGNVLDLGAGFLSVSSVVHGTTDYIIGGDSAQVYLLPVDAAAKERPFTDLRFCWPVFGVPQSIQVTGVCGYGAALPEDVWTILLRMAATDLAPELALLKTGGLLEVKQEGLLRKYAGTSMGQYGPFDGQIKQWSDKLKPKFLFYKRRKFA